MAAVIGWLASNSLICMMCRYFTSCHWQLHQKSLLRTTWLKLLARIKFHLNLIL